MRIAVIIPAYNESESIANVVREVNDLNTINTSHRFTPVVINDCSIDNTASIESIDCVALHLPVNLGIGGADTNRGINMLICNNLIMRYK